MKERGYTTMETKGTSRPNVPSPVNTRCYECNALIVAGDRVNIWKAKASNDTRIYGRACAGKHPKHWHRKPATTTALSNNGAAAVAYKRPKAATPKVAPTEREEITPEMIVTGPSKIMPPRRKARLAGPPNLNTEITLADFVASFQKTGAIITIDFRVTS
jgi:hypothetical protein